MSVISSYREQVRNTCTSSSFFNNRVVELWHFSESFKHVLVLCWASFTYLMYNLIPFVCSMPSSFNIEIVWAWSELCQPFGFSVRKVQIEVQNSALWCCRTLVFYCSSSQCSISVWSWKASLLWFVKVYLGTPGYNVLKHRDSPIEIEIRRNDRLGAAQ